METLKLARITILGSTGSIGLNTLDVIARHPERFVVYALSAHSRIEQLAAQALETKARVVIVPNDLAADIFKKAWPTGVAFPEIRIGQQGLVDTAADGETDVVMAAIVGAAGLPSGRGRAGTGRRSPADC
jgi:1-deoxy-D-xylulose-5-phosphate reductoisomerase